MLKWFTDWLTGKTPEVNEIQTNPFPATDKAPVNKQITDSVTQVVATESPAEETAKPKAGKKPAAKKPATEKPAKATKAKAEKKPAPKAKAKKKQPA